MKYCYGNYKHRSKLLKILCVLIIFFLACSGLVGCAGDEREEVEDNKHIYGDESLCIDPDVDEALSNYRMIEIVGIDEGCRSDVIFVVAINKKTDEAKLFTVYRDTLMKISADGNQYSWGGHLYKYYKCNRSFQKEGNYGSMKMLNSHLDLNIREIIALDFEGVELLIDEIGGIQLDGETLDGKEAVAHLRDRNKPGWDAATRSHRNEDIIIQAYQKMKTINIINSIDLYRKISGHFETNMSKTAIIKLAKEMSTINIEKSDGFPYKYEILWDQWDAFYYWVAKDDLKENVIELHKKVFGQDKYAPSTTMESINEELNTYTKTLHR